MPLHAHTQTHTHRKLYSYKPGLWICMFTIHNVKLKISVIVLCIVADAVAVATAMFLLYTYFRSLISVNVRHIQDLLWMLSNFSIPLKWGSTFSMACAIKKIASPLIRTKEETKIRQWYHWDRIETVTLCVYLTAWHLIFSPFFITFPSFGCL